MESIGLFSTSLSEIAMALVGGALIGLAALGMLISHGKILGVSGIIGGLFHAPKDDRLWRALFLLGLLVGGVLLQVMGFGLLDQPLARSVVAAGIGGLLVGYGTGIANGCTSGHGVCGISRFSPRSVIATGLFMLSGFFMVYVVKTFLPGGAL